MISRAAQTETTSQAYLEQVGSTLSGEYTAVYDALASR